MPWFGRKKEAADTQASPVPVNHPPRPIEEPSQKAQMLLAENKITADFFSPPPSFSQGTWTRPLRPQPDLGVAIDTKARRVCFFIHQYPNLEARVFNAQDILEVELNEDGTQVTKTSTGGVVGRALVGGAISGGIGAVIGGTTAKANTDQRVRSITVQFLVKDTSTPHWAVEFMPPGLGLIKKEGMIHGTIYKQAYSQANKCFGLAKLLMEGAKAPSEASSVSALEALKHKFVNGQISEAEYLQKKTLLE